MRPTRHKTIHLGLPETDEAIICQPLSALSADLQHSKWCTVTSSWRLDLTLTLTFILILVLVLVLLLSQSLFILYLVESSFQKFGCSTSGDNFLIVSVRGSFLVETIARQQSWPKKKKKKQECNSLTSHLTLLVNIKLNNQRL